MSTNAAPGSPQPCSPVQRVQFAQAARAEAGKHREAVGRERALPARQQRRRVGHGVQHHVGPQQSCSAGRHGIGVGVEPHLVVALRPAPGGPPRRARRAAAARGERRRSVRRRCAARAGRPRRAAPRRRPRGPTSRRSPRAAALTIARRSRMRRATSACSQGGSAARARRRNAASSAAASSRTRGLGAGRARQAWRASILSRCRCPRSPTSSLCRANAPCAAAGRARACARPVVQRFAAPTPRCRRCAIDVPAGVDVCGACLLRPAPVRRRARRRRLRLPVGRAGAAPEVPCRARPGRCAGRAAARRRATARRCAAPDLAAAGAAVRRAPARARLQPGRGRSPAASRARSVAAPTRTCCCA